MSMIWATRGRTWGFRFLRTGGLRDPLSSYEAAFAELEGQREGIVRSGDRVALRFIDPEGRRDRAGRAIPHEFVLFGDLALGVSSVGDGLALVWPLVSDEYGALWDSPGPPPPSN